MERPTLFVKHHLTSRFSSTTQDFAKKNSYKTTSVNSMRLMGGAPRAPGGSLPRSRCRPDGYLYQKLTKNCISMIARKISVFYNLTEAVKSAVLEKRAVERKE